MKELLRTNDPVRLSWLVALLADAGVTAVVLDTHTSILEGSIGAIPRRLMVTDGDHAQAHRILTHAGETEAGETQAGAASGKAASTKAASDKSIAAEPAPEADGPLGPRRGPVPADG